MSYRHRGDVGTHSSVDRVSTRSERPQFGRTQTEGNEIFPPQNTLILDRSPSSRSYIMPFSQTFSGLRMVICIYSNHVRARMLNSEAHARNTCVHTRGTKKTYKEILQKHKWILTYIYIYYIIYYKGIARARYRKVHREFMPWTC